MAEPFYAALDREPRIGVDADLDAGAEVVCDWYNIYQGEDGGTPSNGLPSTGAGIAAGGTAPIEAMALAGLVAFAGAVTLRRRIA